jgi:hypothetical protein
MKKEERFNKKNLRNRLAAILTIYMDDISEKKKKRLEKYLDNKLKDVVDYYVALLKKKDRKTLVLPPQADNLEMLTKSVDEIKKKQEDALLKNTDPGIVNAEHATSNPDFSGANEKNKKSEQEIAVAEIAKNEFDDTNDPSNGKHTFSMPDKVAV